MTYEIDKSYDFRVVMRPSTSPDFFDLEVDTNSGPAYVQIKKLPFQRRDSYKIPSTINCRVKSTDADGLPVLSPNIAAYVYSLYAGSYGRGENFECTVVSVPDPQSDDPYMIADSNGIFYRLDNPEMMLAKGQKVRCRFVKLTPRYFSLEAIDEGARLQMFDPAALLEASGVGPELADRILAILDKAPGLENARAELAAGRPTWVMTAASATMQMLPEWFLMGSPLVRRRSYQAMIGALRDVLLHLLEGSSFLSAAGVEQRRAIQQQLTDMADALEPYEITLRLIAEGAEDSFVEGLLDKLQRSGYLYHPARQFAVLMLIFRMHPEKVAAYLSRIFESIFGRDLENWKREPFRSAFVEQFRIYVSQTRRELDILPLAETREQKARIETVVLAIALQLLLTNRRLGLDRSVSLFYRYVSLLRPLNTEDLLTKSFIAILGGDVDPRLTYSQLKEPMMMMTSATVMPDDIFSRISATHRYISNGVEIAVSRAGLSLRPAGRADITERAIPDGLMAWLHPQVNVNGVRSLSGPRLRKLPDHNQWWFDIENNLFEQHHRVENETVDLVVANKQKPRAAVGDQVYIVVDGVSAASTNNPVFSCRIDDTEYADGRGTLRRDRIVGYNLRQPPMKAFESTDGSPLGFLAAVDEVASDGTYVFSLLDEVERFIEERLNFDDEYKAVVTGRADYDYSAISNVGVGLYLTYNEGDDYRIGDVVRFKFSNLGGQGVLKGYITETADDEELFGKAEAFTHLMHSIGEKAETDHAESTAEEEPEEVVPDIDEILTPEQIREIIEIVRFKSIAESDLIKAYDYLRFARLLALAIGESSLADRLLTHASLLALHQFFATNSRIDADKLEELEEPSHASPFLAMLYHRLEIVSWLGRTERNSRLYATVSEPASELEGALASMVLAYNLINSGEGDGPISSDIKQKIMEKLNVNNETRPGKYYGSESKYLEFKTSLVYPATAPGEEMRENPQEQQFHILSRIAGLLNANGGRLYLGVNNDGFEVGLHDDFKYYERHTAYAKTYPFKINSIDKLTVFLEELVNQYFDRKVSRKIEVSVDDEAVKGVVMFKVEPSLEPVFLDGRLFVRQSGQATREYHGKDIDDFVAERATLLAERRRMLEIEEAETKAAADAVAAVSKAEPAPAVAVSAPVADTPETSQSEPDAAMATSHWRPNVLHEYEAGFAGPAGYFYFTTDNTLMFSVQDLYLDGSDTCRLALAVPHELAEGWLVLAYSGERAMRLPVADLMTACAGNGAPLKAGYEPVFAALAGRDDALMCVASDSGGSLSKRVVPVAQLEPGRLNAEPQRIHEAPVDHTVAYDIVDASSVDSFADSMADKMAARRFGMTLRTNENAPNAEAKIKELFNKCAPAL